MCCLSWWLCWWAVVLAWVRACLPGTCARRPVGTVEVQGESEIVDACLTSDCSRVLVVNAGATSFKSWNIHSFERVFKRRRARKIELVS